MFVTEKEPYIVVSLSKEGETLKLIDQSGRFTVVLASEKQEDLYEQLAAFRSPVLDKFAAIGIHTLIPRPGRPLIPKDSAAWFECEPVDRKEINGYVVIIARVTEYEETENPPLIWQKEEIFSLKFLSV